MGLLSKIKKWLGPASTTYSNAPPEKAEREKVLEKISVYRRKTWFPVVDEEDQEDPTASRIGGRAFIPAGEEHPKCPNCGKELTLFLQLKPESLPENNDLDLEADKLIQLFYCTSKDPNCELECEAYFPFSKSVLARTIEFAGRNFHPSYTIKRKSRQFPEKGITDWIPYDDFPDWHEMQAGDAQLSEQEVEVLETSETGVPKAADKLSGWPYWVQGVEYPTCPLCGIQMQMIFQLDSNHHLPYMFGDSGVGHLHQCRLHKNVLAFNWAGY